MIPEAQAELHAKKNHIAIIVKAMTHDFSGYGNFLHLIFSEKKNDSDVCWGL